MSLRGCPVPFVRRKVTALSRFWRRCSCGCPFYEAPATKDPFLVGLSSPLQREPLASPRSSRGKKYFNIYLKVSGKWNFFSIGLWKSRDSDDSTRFPCFLWTRPRCRQQSHRSLSIDDCFVTQEEFILRSHFSYTVVCSIFQNVNESYFLEAQIQWSIDRSRIFMYL